MPRAPRFLQDPPPWTVHAVMASVVVFWSGAFPAIKVGLEALSPAHLTLARFVVAAAPFAAVLGVKGVPRFSRRELALLPLLAFLSVPGYHVALNWGEQFTPAGTASLIIASAPVWTAIFSRVALGERFTPRKVAGVALALVGVVVIVVLGKGGIEIAVDYAWGALAILAAAVGWAVYTVISKPMLARHNSLAFTAAVTLAGTLLLAPVAPGFPEALGAMGPGPWMAVVFLGVLATAYGYFGFVYCLSRITPTETMVYLYLVPALAILWSWLLLGEVVSPWALAGGVMVIAGVALTNLRRRGGGAVPEGAAGRAEASSEGAA